ncbi:MAG: hypothetical protein IAF38_13015, partial [Bacteroidia bacterium]|nr:hypothetical protein [Bacteroidia bacterium]
MKKNFLLIAIVLTGVITNAQDCFWLKGFTTPSGTHYEQGTSVATDAQGNVYVTGDFNGPSITIGTTTLTNAFSSNFGGIFVVKYNAAGTVLWAKGADGAMSHGIAVDKNGNVFITGGYNPSITFGSTTLNSVGYGDIFIAKYDSLGNELWAKSAGGISNEDWAISITTDNSGNAIITGEFYSSSMTIGSTVLNNNGTSGPDFFIAKYDLAGNVLWAKSGGGTNYDAGYDVATDKSNHIYFTGIYQSSSVSFGATTITNAGSASVFVTKYDSAGNVNWVKNLYNGVGIINSGDCQLALDSLANVYVTGEIGENTMALGTYTLNNNPVGDVNIFIAKFDSSSSTNAVWANCVGSSGYEDFSMDVDVDAGGNSYITGFFKGANITFGTSVLTNPNLSSPMFYIGKYDKNGVAQWGKTRNGSGMAFGRGVANGIGDNVYCTGNFNGASLTFGNASINNNSSSDFFVFDTYSFSTGIVSSSNVSCNGGNNGTAVVSASGGNPPITFSWGTTPPQTTAAATGLYAGTNVVTITEGYGCVQTYSVTLTEPAPDVVSICLVTVDSNSQHNIIMWDKTPFTDVDSFIIYREIATNNYQPIGAVHFDSLSQFVDTTETLYFPNTGNPNAGTYRYKIKAHTTCGGYTAISPY